MSSTAHERILRLLRQPYPRWHPATSFGPDYHKLATRVGELNGKGWDVLSRKSTRHRYASGRAQQEYRLNSIG